MAFIAAAAAGARLLSSAARRAAAPLTNASYSTAGPSASDIEDSPLPRRSRLAQFRERRALAVTDITATEWCEKKMEFELKHGKPERTEAMKAGSDRHAQLEHEVFQRVDIAHSHRSSRNNGSRNEERGTRNDAWDGILHCGNENVLYSHQNGVPGTWNAPSFHDPGDYDITIRSVEESWAVKFVSFIEGTNRLMLEDELKDVAREIPVFGVIEGTWIIGIIDEIRMHMDGISVQPILIDTKTRAKPTIPSEPQKRNGRLQLMCYKYLWDSLIAKKFPAENFFSYFDLDPNYLLSDHIKWYTNSLGVNAKTLEDVVKYFKITCHSLGCLRSREQLLLRYEFQEDHSLLDEYQFTYDAKWFKDQIQGVLSFWQGSREPRFVTEEERWKCDNSICKFAPICPMIASSSKR